MQMIDSQAIAADDILDALADLKHDLGKYLRLPFGMLPADASHEMISEALDTAINRTRTGPSGVRCAASIWAEFTREAGAALSGSARYDELGDAVARALAWSRFTIAGAPPIDRASVERDLRAVSERIQALMEEVAGD